MGTVEAVFDLIRVALLFVTVAVAATTDTLSRRVPNVVTYPAMALGLALGFGIGQVGLDASLAQHHLLSHTLGLLVAAGIFLIAWWAGGVKGGEVKLAGAVGALGGLQFAVAAMFWSSVIGAIMALWLLLLRGRLLEGLRRSVRYALLLRADPPPKDDPARLSIPYAVAIAFGTVWTFFLVEATR
ncbi:MAG: prepilin peptidase [Planctomycetes bacterium]|nr:prepilin peptidase [Planctomycetota bacterium]